MTLQQSTLDLVRMPILLVDRGRRIELANRSAREMLRASATLLERDGRLRLRDRQADRMLGEALCRVGEASGEAQVVRLGPGRPGVQVPALIVTVLGGAASGPPATLAVRILEPEPAAPDGESTLRLLLDLTPPESAVALGLAEGLSHDDIARRRGVKVTTVRSTLRRLQEKLGIRKSSRLARLIHGVATVGGLRL